MSKVLTHRDVDTADLEKIIRFPQNENELYFMFPKADFPLTTEQLQLSINNRFDSTVAILNNEVVGFANFYEAIPKKHCAIGNVIVNPDHRGKGIGIFLIETMETIATKKHNVKELHISCFNENVTGILLYRKLGYMPYDIEKRIDKKSSPIALIKMKKIV